MINFSPIINFKYFFLILKNFKINFYSIIKIISKNTKDYKLFSKSSWSLLYICLLRKYFFKKKTINIFFPEYYCDEALNQIRSLSFVKIYFYQINEDLSPNIIDIKRLIKLNTPDLLVISHYFDYRTNSHNLINISNNSNCWLIEDATHCLIENHNIGKNSDFVMFSPYKWFGTNNGAILLIKENGSSKLSNVIAFNSLNSKILDKEILSVYYKYKHSKIFIYSEILFFMKICLNNIGIRKKKYLFKNLNDEINYISYPFIGFLSKLLIISFFKNLHEIINTRKFNYFFIKKLILDNFGSNKSIKINSINEIPFFIEINGETHILDKLQSELLKYKITSFYWPNIPREIKQNNSNDRYKFLNILKSKKLYIPAHQSINIKLIKKTFHNKFDYKYKHNIKIFRITDNSFTDNISESSYINISQSNAYGNARNKINRTQVKKYLIEADNQAVGQFQTFEKNYFLFKVTKINKGPLFIKGTSEKLKIEIFRKIFDKYNILKLNILIFSPPIEFNFENIGLFFKLNFRKIIFNNYSTLLLDLSKDLDEINKKFDQKWRNILRKSIKLNNDIKIKNFTDNSKLYLEYYYDNKQLKFYKRINKKILNKLSKNLKVFESHYNNKIISFQIIFINKKNATYLVGWNSNDGYKKHSHYSLIWEVIQYLKKNNCVYFDLGGIDIFNNPKVSHFKMGITDNTFEYYGDVINF